MLSNSQKSLVKQAQRDAGLSDEEYREAWWTIVAGASSSTDPRLADEHMDTFMSYLEAIYWGKRDAGEVVASKIFRTRGYWARKNTKTENSRDRFAIVVLKQDVAELERQLAELGYSASYCAVIRKKVTRGDAECAYALALYRNALSRTLAAKRKRAGEKRGKGERESA